MPRQWPNSRRGLVSSFPLSRDPGEGPGTDAGSGTRREIVHVRDENGKRIRPEELRQIAGGKMNVTLIKQAPYRPATATLTENSVDQPRLGSIYGVGSDCQCGKQQRTGGGPLAEVGYGCG